MDMECEGEYIHRRSNSFSNADSIKKVLNSAHAQTCKPFFYLWPSLPNTTNLWPIVALKL